MSAAHTVHVVADMVLAYFPGWQFAQCVAAEALAYVPAPHGVHVIEIGLEPEVTPIAAVASP